MEERLSSPFVKLLTTLPVKAYEGMTLSSAYNLKSWHSTYMMPWPRLIFKFSIVTGGEIQLQK